MFAKSLNEPISLERTVPCAIKANMQCIRNTVYVPSHRFTTYFHTTVGIVYYSPRLPDGGGRLPDGGGRLPDFGGGPLCLCFGGGRDPKL